VKDQPDVYAMDLLLTLLEHENGGRLPRLLRGQAAVQARFETRRQPGILSIVASTGSTPPEDVEALIRKELDFLRNHPVTAAELAVAKRALRGSYALDNETLSGQASSLGYYDAIDTWQFACEYLSQVEAITPAQLNEVVHKYVLLDRCVTLVLKPRATGGVPPRGNVQ
jgi:zinc protease